MNPLIPSAAPVSVSGTDEQAGSFKDAPRCHRVGGSDDNTELSDGMATPALL